MALAPDVAGFSRLITALDPWLDRVVIVGGWAHRLYRLHPSALTLDFAPLMTLDADVALRPTLPARTPTIRDALAANGFEEEFRGDDMPPATLYHLGDKDSGFYAEFLTPLTGSDHTRSGKRKATAQVAGVVPAQPEMETERFPLVSIPPFGRGFSRHGGLSIRWGFRKSAKDGFRARLDRLDEPARLSLGMVASPQSPLPFHLAEPL
jgi:hypothetical protein